MAQVMSQVSGWLSELVETHDDGSLSVRITRPDRSVVIVKLPADEVQGKKIDELKARILAAGRAATVDP